MNHGRLRNCVSIQCKKKKNKIKKQTKNKHKQNKTKREMISNLISICSVSSCVQLL